MLTLLSRFDQNSEWNNGGYAFLHEMVAVNLLSIVQSATLFVHWCFAVLSVLSLLPLRAVCLLSDSKCSFLHCLLLQPWNVFCFRLSQFTIGFLLNHTPSQQNARYDTDVSASLWARLFTYCISCRLWLGNWLQSITCLSCYSVVCLCILGLFWICGTT